MSNSIVTYQVLFDFLKLLTEYQKDPGALAKAAKEAYALGPAEKQKADDARRDIAANKKLLEDTKAEQSKLAEAASLLEDEKKKHNDKKASDESYIQQAYQKLKEDKEAHVSEVNTTMEGLRKTAAALDFRKANLDEQEKQNKKVLDSFESREQALKTQVDSFAKIKSDLDARQAEIEAYESKIKKRASNLKAQIEDL